MYELQRLGPTGRVTAKRSSNGRSDGGGAGLLHAAHRHAEVLCFDDHDRTARFQLAFHGFDDLDRHTLLHLQSTGVAFDQSCQLRKSRDVPAGPWEIRQVRETNEGHEMMLAERSEGDVSNHHHLVVA